MTKGLDLPLPKITVVVRHGAYGLSHFIQQVESLASNIREKLDETKQNEIVIWSAFSLRAKKTAHILQRAFKAKVLLRSTNVSNEGLNYNWLIPEMRKIQDDNKLLIIVTHQLFVDNFAALFKMDRKEIHNAEGIIMIDGQPEYIGP